MEDLTPPPERTPPLTPERIEAATKYGLAYFYPELNAQDGTMSPSVHDIGTLQEQMAELTRMYGSANVLPSFYEDESGVVRLGLFVRPLRYQPSVHELDEVRSRPPALRLIKGGQAVRLVGGTATRGQLDTED